MRRYSLNFIVFHNNYADYRLERYFYKMYEIIASIGCGF
jgi:hypothetical protein